MPIQQIKNISKNLVPANLRHYVKKKYIKSKYFNLFPPKFSCNSVKKTFENLKKKAPQKDIVILGDGYINLAPLPWLNCRNTAIDYLDGFDFKNTIFIYACDSDEIGLPFIQHIVLKGGSFFPVSVITPSLYININDKARTVLEKEYIDQVNEGFAKWDTGPYDFINLIQAIDITSSLGGDYVEIGCFRGSSSRVALRYMKENQFRRNCYFLDVFDGFNYEAAKKSSDAVWAGSHKTEGPAKVRERLEKYQDCNHGPSVFVIKNNIIEEQLPSAIRQIALANIDVDIYDAVKEALDKVSPRVIAGGIIIAEDAGHTPYLIGARLALKEFLESEQGQYFTPVYMQSGQTFLIKKG
ncbi:MAG: TylF/MycF/NovP-related O-methyltransferase [bacterium]